MSLRSLAFPAEIWANIISLSASLTDVKNISLVGKQFHYECLSRLWYSISLCVGPKDCKWSSGLEKLPNCLELLDSNKNIERHVKKIIVASEYPIRAHLIHKDQLIRIVSRFQGLIHVVVTRSPRVAFNMDAFNRHNPEPNDIHAMEYRPFFDESMVLAFPAGIIRLDGIFPGRHTANAFVLAQSRTLRTWIGLDHRDVLYFMESNVTPPPLISLSIANTRHYQEICTSTMLQTSLRALRIGGALQTGFTFDAKQVFPTLHSFAALESLAISLPWLGAKRYLAEMGTALPRLRRLTLCSNRVMHYDLIPGMPYLERLVLRMVEYLDRLHRHGHLTDPNRNMGVIEETPGRDRPYIALLPLSQRCPRLLCIEIPDYVSRPWRSSPGNHIETLQKGRRVSLWVGGFEEVMGLPASNVLEDDWMY